MGQRKAKGIMIFIALAMLMTAHVSSPYHGTAPPECVPPQMSEPTMPAVEIQPLVTSPEPSPAHTQLESAPPPEPEPEPENISDPFTLPGETCGSFKSFMSYRAITSRTSRQWDMQQRAWTDENGLRRYGDYVMVALGTYYAPQVELVFEITLSGGVTFRAITGDIKSDNHTDLNRQFTRANGCMIEFIVDTSAICRTVRRMGDVSFAGYHGEIVEIREVLRP